jgi:hypothetical protein
LCVRQCLYQNYGECIDVLHIQIDILQNTEINAERYTFDRKEKGSWTQSDHSTEMTVWKHRLRDCRHIRNHAFSQIIKCFKQKTQTK